MKKSRSCRDDAVLWRFFCFTTVFFVLFFAAFSLLSPPVPGTFRPVLVTAWPHKALVKVVSGESSVIPAISIRETVLQPDEKLFFLRYVTSNDRPLAGARLITRDDVVCVYSLTDSEVKQPPESLEAGDHGDAIVRCPLQPPGGAVSIGLKSGPVLTGPKAHKWDSLAYEAIIDHDGSTVVFVKGLNLRSGRVSDPSRFECVYGWDFRSTRFVLREPVISIAQEIVRCRTPLSILNRPHWINSSVKVSVRLKGKEIVPSIARPGTRPVSDTKAKKPHEVCVCTMARNQGRFLKEWIMYHTRIGVTRWFIYDNNSNDDSDEVIEWLSYAGHNITKHSWPWIKTQEAGFAHCALRARTHCQWVGFIDVDEFFHSPSGRSLPDVIGSKSGSGSGSIGEIRFACHDFGPSGHREAPREGVTAGYTCRVAVPERHKSVVRPEALSESLVNVVHHFDLREGFRHAYVDRGTMVLNHYKYQVWSVFKEKFRRRVATYVADWQDELNPGSRDRAPGLGFKAVEPADWSTRFCEVWDTGLKDRVVRMFADPETNRLPWQK